MLDSLSLLIIEKPGELYATGFVQIGDTITVFLAKNEPATVVERIIQARLAHRRVLQR